MDALNQGEKMVNDVSASCKEKVQSVSQGACDMVSKGMGGNVENKSQQEHQMENPKEHVEVCFIIHIKCIYYIYIFSIEFVFSHYFLFVNNFINII